MKFEQLYPQLATTVLAFPQNLLGPHQDVVPEPGLAQTWRAYPCVCCGARTSWRLLLEGQPGAAICSQECRLVFGVDVENRQSISEKVLTQDSVSDSSRVATVEPNPGLTVGT